MEKDLERLIRYIRKEDVALFVGSGFSIKLELQMCGKL